MADVNRLGNNIRNLRKAHGETQEQLGAILHVEKNTVSYYECGRSEPSEETLTRIAKHYMVSVEELLYSDLTIEGRITIHMDAFWKNIHVLFPIVSSETAMQNDHFKKAFAAHKDLYDQLPVSNFDKASGLFVNCIDEYFSIAEDEAAFVDASANLVSIFFLFLMIPLKTGQALIKNQPALLRQIVAQDKKAKKALESADFSLLSDDEAELEDTMQELLVVIKHSVRRSDLADYYIALQYMFGLVNNGLSLEFNRRIGHEMMCAFFSVENPYAARFLKYTPGITIEASSQTVNDKR